MYGMFLFKRNNYIEILLTATCGGPVAVAVPWTVRAEFYALQY